MVARVCQNSLPKRLSDEETLVCHFQRFFIEDLNSNDRRILIGENSLPKILSSRFSSRENALPDVGQRRCLMLPYPSADRSCN